MQEIPLTSNPSQTFSMTLGGVNYNFRVIYNTRLKIWSMDLSAGNTRLADGVALVQGIDILSPYNLALKNLYVLNTSASGADATANNLGTDVKLFLLTDEEVASVTPV